MIRFDAAAFALSLRVTEDGTTELAPAAEAPAVSLLVPLQQWPLVAADVADGGQAAAMRHVRLEGDAELANTVSMLARNLRWDAAEDLSRAFAESWAARRATAWPSAWSMRAPGA